MAKSLNIIIGKSKENYIPVEEVVVRLASILKQSMDEEEKRDDKFDKEQFLYKSLDFIRAKVLGKK